MKDVNNFQNLFHVTAKSFEQLKQKMSEVPVPCSILTIEEKAIGTFYAILMADRKIKGRPQKTEI